MYWFVLVSHALGLAYTYIYIHRLTEVRVVPRYMSTTPHSPLPVTCALLSEHVRILSAIYPIALNRPLRLRIDRLSRYYRRRKNFYDDTSKKRLRLAFYTYLPY